MQHLQDLGLDTSDASMLWVTYDNPNPNFKQYSPALTVLTPIEFYHGSVEKEDIIPAFTFTDIWDKFPHTEERYAEIDNKFSEPRVAIYDSEEGYTLFSDDDLLTNAYNALCYCIEQGYC